ncbi:DUF3710 domain-containing protein [Sinomonas sp. JGH33]|uniref:DUF3710 domain-containing protein n=1 Tax=Sinomonas terricola TaxID=3110330 RepID=A0ABU5T3N7_9MICC|nr:DUF3710 domain-containing protein [Sinomonas sp. JGH33]MEA5454276.1 DUF3710 domain-containing protein [Sinomonas sp. JGH33]
MLFGRGKNAKLTAEDPTVLGAPRRRPEPDKSGYGRPEKGPFDASEKDTAVGYVDLGAILIRPIEGLQIRLEVEEATRRVVAVTMDLNGSSLQVQAFAAPRSEGLWGEIRAQIAQSVESQGGTVEEVEGSFGPELVAKLPTSMADGRRGHRVAHFMGVDGPRWFLRGVISGHATSDRAAAAELEELFRSVVVDRGESPLPPSELLPLRLPVDQTEGDAAPNQAPSAPERGPEITHLG